jgi:hypothetical protein
LAGKIPGELPDGNDVTRGNPLRITDFLFERGDDLVRELCTEKEIAEMADEIGVRVDVGTFAAVPLE